MKTKSVENQKPEAPLSYAIGTTVQMKDPEHHLAGRDMVVTTVSIVTGSLEYAVHGNAWYSHDSLVFVSMPTAESIAVAALIESEEDEDEDEG